MFKRLIFTMFFTLTACGLETYQNGDLPANTRLESIQVGDSQDKLLRVLGTPNYVSTSVEGVEPLYIYAQTKKESRIFFHPSITQQDVYVFVFDKNNKVKRKVHLDQNSMKKVAYDSEITKIGEDNQSLLKQLADNFGKYNAGGQDSTIRR